MKRIFTNEHVKVEKTTPLFKGFFEIKKFLLRHKLFQGGWSPLFERELFERGSVVGVLLFDPKKDLFVLLEQFRVGALHHEQSPWLFEIVAGVIEQGEQPAEVAFRETLEESGCTIEKLIEMPDYWVSPGGSSEYVHLYLGIIDSQQVSQFAGLETENEDIKVHLVKRKQLLNALKSGAINNAMALIAVQWFLLNEQSLKIDS